MTDRTIGTGKTYASIALWEADTDNDLVSATTIERGLLANEVHVGDVTIAGATTSALYYRELTTDTGCSFRDNANVQTNALRYNESNGAAVKTTSGYSFTLKVGENYCRINKLQLTATIGNSSALDGFSASPTNCTFDSLIIQGSGGDEASPLGMGNSTNTISNSVVIQTGSNKTVLHATGGALYNCTLVSIGASSQRMLYDNYSTITMQNCGVFGFASISFSGFPPTATTCYTDVASPPTGFTTTAYSTSTGAKFQNISAGTQDLRIQSGSSLLDVGTTDSTHAATDIAGTARPQGSAYDVGCWELVAGGGGTVIPVFMNQYRQRRT